MNCYNFKKQILTDEGSTIKIKNLLILKLKINLYYLKKNYLNSSIG